MSVTEFNYDSFRGLRVMRKAGGEQRCRYFSFLNGRKNGGDKRHATPGEIRKIWQAAEDYDRTLENWQHERQSVLQRQAIPTVRNTTTPVRGIRLGMIIQIKRGRRYEWPGFIVGIRDAAGQNITRQYPIRTHGFDGAWAHAVKTLVKEKRWPATSIPVLLARKPDQSHLQSVLGPNGEYRR
jgi:hypothetical protein